MISCPCPPKSRTIMPSWCRTVPNIFNSYLPKTRCVVCCCAGFRMPGCRDHRCARRAGVRKAPRQEIAGCGAPTVQRALWGFGVGESVGEVEARLAIGSLKVESWACVLARTSGSHVVRQDLRCHHGPVLLIGAGGCASGREPARMARFGAVLDQR